MLSTTQPAGVWDFVQDSGAANTLWSSLTLESELNSGDVFVEVRAADSVTELTSWPFQRLVGANGTIPLQSPSIKGRYIEVRVNLFRRPGQTRAVHRLTVSLASILSSCLYSSFPRAPLRVSPFIVHFKNKSPFFFLDPIAHSDILLSSRSDVSGLNVAAV